MATVAEPRSCPVEGEQRFVIPGVGWDGYQALLDLIGDRAIRLTYDRGDVELMAPLYAHGRFGNLIGYLVEALADELEMPRVGAGSTTFRAQMLDRGLEPDECDYFANAARLRDTDRIDLAIDPPPDLAIEIEITRGALDRLGISAALGVPEVWRFDGERLTVHVLGQDATYRESPTSAAFPFVPMAEVARFVREYDANNDTRWGRAFRAWVRAQIVPRAEGRG
ncbi:MAG TPA: Uma2 family endonuclease [Isosphaeraceae bacterium]|jgi:Uma2 family endonuclease|nr:Uma2 family endonuclease [Isosphaeraceae bacterium]